MLTIDPAKLDKLEAAICQRSDECTMRQALEIIADVRKYEAAPELVEAARDRWQLGHGPNADEIEIDDRASTSPSDEGTWVSAWVWMAADSDDEEDEADELPDVPADFPVQPIEFQSAEYHETRARDALAQCGTCSRMWDDAQPTQYTPAPSGRCPFEAFHADAVPLYDPRPGEEANRRAAILRDLDSRRANGLEFKG